MTRSCDPLLEDNSFLAMATLWLMAATCKKSSVRVVSCSRSSVGWEELLAVVSNNEVVLCDSGFPDDDDSVYEMSS